ncbi:unnamed protein product [Rangifer tarandus platyrhynchus]|uniref:Uncharacterized protein n=1 Tax=Rangifer tarandus platyrhynchus TaxID=3082113 RepID=A0AC59YPA8_RANTA
MLKHSGVESALASFCRLQFLSTAVSFFKDCALPLPVAEPIAAMETISALLSTCVNVTGPLVLKKSSYLLLHQHFNSWGN